MPEELNAKIRRFRPEDRDSVRRIAFNTAFMGEPASVFFDAKEILCDGLTAYFTDFEPESTFIAEVDSKVIGYLIGAKDKRVLDKIVSRKIILGLLKDLLLSRSIFKKKNIVFLLMVILSGIKGEFFSPDFTGDYPAILHINIEKDYRGNNLGSELMASYFDYLSKEGIAGVHLFTMSKRAGEFFAKQGFRLLYSGKRSYFRHILHRDVPLLVYGRKVSE